MINTAQKEKKYAPVTYSRRMRVAELPPEIISKIIVITSKGNDATVKRKKDGFKVYETKLVEK